MTGGGGSAGASVSTAIGRASMGALASSGARKVVNSTKATATSARAATTIMIFFNMVVVAPWKKVKG